MMKCRFSYIEQGDPVALECLGQNLADPGIEEGYHAYLDNCFSGLLLVSIRSLFGIYLSFDRLLITQ